MRAESAGVCKRRRRVAGETAAPSMSSRSKSYKHAGTVPPTRARCCRCIMHGDRKNTPLVQKTMPVLPGFDSPLIVSVALIGLYNTLGYLLTSAFLTHKLFDLFGGTSFVLSVWTVGFFNAQYVLNCFPLLSLCQ
jgi:hypothetical protein